jgi:hypothetical protein
MEITKYEHLLVLHRALMERHFCEEVFSRELIGSPYLAEISNHLLDEIIAIDVSRKGEAKAAAWSTWRQLTPAKHRVWRILCSHLMDSSRRSFLRKASTEDRHQYIRDMASPYTVADEAMNELDLVIERDE